MKPSTPKTIYATINFTNKDRFTLVRQDELRAAIDAGVNAQIVDTMSQACDHPVGLPYPEGLYLKGFAVRVMQ